MIPHDTSNSDTNSVNLTIKIPCQRKNCGKTHGRRQLFFARLPRRVQGLGGLAPHGGEEVSVAARWTE